MSFSQTHSAVNKQGVKGEKTVVYSGIFRYRLRSNEGKAIAFAHDEIIERVTGNKGVRFFMNGRFDGNFRRSRSRIVDKKALFVFGNKVNVIYRIPRLRSRVEKLESVVGFQRVSCVGGRSAYYYIGSGTAHGSKPVYPEHILRGVKRRAQFQFYIV